MKEKVGILLLVLLLCCGFADDGQELPSLQGRLVYHSYVSYDDKGSRLCVFDFESGEMRDISEEISAINPGVEHAMNGHFGSATDIVFMAMELNQWGYDHWYVYHYNLDTKALTNLVAGSEYNYEDPKYAPDGSRIVMKRRIWQDDDWSYSLVEMDMSTKDLTVLLEDGYENSMPYYSRGGNRIYYAQYDGVESKIYSLNRADLQVREEYAEQGVYAYYPVVRWTGQEEVYFSKWHSSSNRADKIAQLTQTGYALLPFNTQEAADYSDACPVGEGYMMLSATLDGTYDLYLADCETGELWPMSLYSPAINTDHRNELGAHYRIKALGPTKNPL